MNKLTGTQVHVCRRPPYDPYTRTAFAQCQIAARIALALILSLVVATAVLAEPPIAGRWQLDPAASTDPATELKGIRVSKKKFKPRSVQPRDSRQGGATEQRYWQEANAGSEWQHSRELAHAGPLQRLLESNNLEIIAQDTGFLFIYADGFERPVLPNPAGRVFTASGDELVKTEVGYTLAFWDGETLVLESRLKRGGKLLEHVTIEPDDSLSVAIEIDRRDWKWVAKLERRFVRAD